MSAIPRWAAVLAGLAVAVASRGAFAEADWEKEAGNARRVKVITPVDQVWQMVPDEKGLWMATDGGVKRWDRGTGQWEFCTRYDGLASNAVTALGVLEGQVYAFHSMTNEVSIRDGKTGKWSAKTLGGKLQRGFWSNPWSMQQVREDGIWAIFTGLPDREFGPPSVIEVQQYDRESLQLAGSVDVRKALPQTDAVRNSLFGGRLGLAFESGYAWVAVGEHLVRVDPKSWKTEVIALPQIDDGGEAGRPALRRTIQSIAAGENCLWLGMEKGLAKYDPQKKEFSFLLEKNEFRRVFMLLPDGGTLWFAGYTGPICRLDLKTEKMETVALDPPPRLVGQMVVQGGEAWVTTEAKGVGRIDLKTGRVTQIQHEKFAAAEASGGPLALLEEMLIGWGNRWEAKAEGGERRVWGIQMLDLKSDREQFLEFSGSALMVPWRERIWLVGYKSVTPLFPLEGRLGATVGEGGPGLIFSNPPEVVSERMGKLYLQTRSFQKDAKNANAEQIFAFEPETGKLELLFEVPEEWRSANARIMGVQRQL